MIMSFSRTLKDKSRTVWEDGYNHPFLHEMGKGILDREAFKFYLLQDYIYLIEYAKIFAMGAVKATDEKLMTNFTVIQHAILYEEMDLHRKYMNEFGIALDENHAVKPSLYNKAYTSNMMSVAQTGGVAEIIAVIFPCTWTYYDYATRLKEQYRDSLEGNFYQTWIENYASDEFRDSFQWFYDTLDALCEHKTEQELEAIEDIFRRSVEFEYLFWDMSYKRQLSYF
jgi:thiaminase/transcriptional activator TenA